MAEEFLRSRQYEYRMNSNLVLEAERDPRRRDEATGEVESLYGRVDSIKMGDRLGSSRSTELTDRIERLKRQQTEHLSEERRPKRSRLEAGSVLAASEESMGYRPRTRESRIAYEELLSLVSGLIGDQPQDVLRGAAEEALAILKDSGLRDLDRQREMGKLLPHLGAEPYNRLVGLSRRINDFNDPAEEPQESRGLDEEVGVAVVFDDDSEDEQGSEVADEEVGSDDDEGGVETLQAATLQGQHGEDVDEEDVGLSVHEIDAHWLQRQLSRHFPDATESASLAEEVLGVLQATDERLVENRLVQLLDFDKFALIKLLLRNRAKILYCTRLKQAQDDDQRKAVVEAMRADLISGGPQLLEQLNQRASAESWTQDRIGEFAVKARREARALTQQKTDTKDDDAEGVVGGVRRTEGFIAERLLDLENLQFAQGNGYSRCSIAITSRRKSTVEQSALRAAGEVLEGTEEGIRGGVCKAFVT